MTAGTLLQLKGPFAYGQNVLGSNFSDKIKFGISLDMKDYLPYGKYDGGFSFSITTDDGNVPIKIGKTCMYETDEPVIVKGLQFIKPSGDPDDYTPESVIINIVIY